MCGDLMFYSLLEFFIRDVVQEKTTQLYSMDTKRTNVSVRHEIGVKESEATTSELWSCYQIGWR